MTVKEVYDLDQARRFEHYNKLLQEPTLEEAMRYVCDEETHRKLMEGEPRSVREREDYRRNSQDHAYMVEWTAETLKEVWGIESSDSEENENHDHEFMELLDEIQGWYGEKWSVLVEEAREKLGWNKEY
jgi:hypothetical protein